MANDLSHSMAVTSDLLRQTLDGIAAAVYIKDSEHRWVFANAACCRLLARSREDLMGLSEAEIWPTPLAAHFCQQDQCVLSGHPSREETVTLSGAAGQKRQMRRRTVLAENSHQVICFLEPVADRPSAPAPNEETSVWNIPQLSVLLSNIPAMIYRLYRHSDGRIQFSFVSPGAFEVFGLSPEAIRSSSASILTQIHPLDLPKFDVTLAASAATLEPWNWEGRYYRSDGKLCWLQTIARPRPLPDGTVVWDGLLMDISAQKQVETAKIERAVMEQALADNETRFRTITATIPGALIQFRAEAIGQYVIDFASDRIQDIIGLSPQAIMEDTDALFERIYPLDSYPLRSTIDRAVARRSNWQFEGRVATSTGDIRWWRIDAVLVPQAQNDVVFCGVIIDITDHKTVEEAYRENERQLRMALNVSGMGVWTWDIATDRMSWTTEPGTLFETRAAEVFDTFESYIKNVHPNDRYVLKQAVSQALETGEDYHIEYRLSLGERASRWVGERGGLWRNPDGIVLGLMGTVVDVTGRKLADAALKASEERNRTLIENIPGAVYRCQANDSRTVLFKSDAIADITGYLVEHPIHYEDWRLIHPDDRAWVDEQIRAAISRCQPFELEYRILHADDSIRWVQNTGQPIPDVTGTVQFIDGVLTDITRRKESENRQQELARRDALINRISGQIRESLDLDTILQTTVQAVRSQLLTDRAAIYRLGPDWSNQLVVEDAATCCRIAVDAHERDSFFPRDLARRCSASPSYDIDDIYHSGLEDHHIQYLESVQVRASLIVPILQKTEPWGLLIAYECSGARHWTTSEKDLLLALAGQVGIAIGQADLYRQATENAARAQQQATDLETTLTELRQTQAQLVQTEKMSSLGQLVAGVAHEINNPVSFIDGNIGHAWEYAQDLLHLLDQYQATFPNPPEALKALIAEKDLDFITEDFPKLLQSMRIGAERIKKIVASLRTFSRMDEAEIKAVNIHDGLDSTLMILQHRLKANGDRPCIEVSKTYGALPPVECYAGQLNQVFMNLISNAIDALEEQIATGIQPHPPLISITTAWVGADHVRIAIADNGPGISNQARSRIFEPFYTTKPIGKGTGIGLSISYQIITERHSGTLDYVSRPGEGTTFHITIPVTQGTT